ncbi:D-serine/D-alanine/glycine transporter [Actinomyces bovis]|uniref:D-serine/D-alanine/glycine transporter n=1 Tax=Actinomyces bovis TaxID=1658 RepID=A0ABY1VRH0_9ACTO|nr:amino acid permease [Actinomyces bovis]SPT54428.1 D-serine/D-alanine/glycine transporter [Actinomyces bovis]VEG55981.1 D-serine/D-alanine/glycine transporter [Actinomyces israelii]
MNRPNHDLPDQPGNPTASDAVDQLVDELNQDGLQRRLTNRHVQLIAIGGAIGTGLFMGSGKTISLAGPGVLLVYAIIGFVLFFVMRALGEVLLSDLSYKSFADVATDLIGPWAGFMTGWTYYFCWLVTAIAEVVVVTGYVQFWLPEVPLWLPAVVTVLLLLGLNLTTVKAFGEIEFWFSIIKILAIVGLVVVGVVMVAAGFTAANGSQAAVSNLWSDGGLFPNGSHGFFGAFQIAVFAFVGTELIGTAAAEAKDPEVTLPKAINAIPVRIVVFYLGALAAIMMVTPWREVSPDKSPFVAMFSLAGFAAAAGLVNFVVLTAAASSANSGIYSTSRMLYGLAWADQGPHLFKRLTARAVPGWALLVTCVGLLASIPLMYMSKSIIAAFTTVTTVASVLFILVWGVIVASYLRYRHLHPERHAKSAFKMPGGRVAAWLSLGFFGFVTWTLTLADDTRTAVLVSPLWLVALGIAWMVHSRHLARRQ